jgi:hypothetical protein
MLSPNKYCHTKFHDNLSAAELFHAVGHVRQVSAMASEDAAEEQYVNTVLLCSATDHFSFPAHHFCSQQQLNQTTAKTQSIACTADSTGNRRTVTGHLPAGRPDTARGSHTRTVHLTK